MPSPAIRKKEFVMSWLRLILINFLIPTAVLASSAMPPSPVELTKPKRALMINGVVATGELFANRAITLKPEMSGKIVALHLPEGKHVDAGTVLIELDSRVAKAQLQQAVAKHDNSKLRYQRLQSLVEKGTGSQSDRDEAYATMRFEEANVSLAKTQLEKTKIKAPFAGVLGLRQVSLGDYVDPGQALINLNDIQELLIDFSLPEKYLTELKSDQKIQVNVPSVPGIQFVGKIIALAPQINHANHSIQVRAQLSNPTQVLRPGLFAKVKVIFSENANAWMLPEQAVFSTQGKQYVYLVKNEQAQLQEVATGNRENGEVEIVKGLNAEDSIVKSGHMKLYPGAKVFEVKS